MKTTNIKIVVDKKSLRGCKHLIGALLLVFPVIALLRELAAKELFDYKSGELFFGALFFVIGCLWLVWIVTEYVVVADELDELKKKVKVGAKK